MTKPFRKDVFKPTDDDWYSNWGLSIDYKEWRLDKRLVCVSVSALSNARSWSKTETRVCIWGNDDTGLERDYNNRQDAVDMFMRVIGQENVNKKWLAKNGFVVA